MPAGRLERRLTAILAADVAGYSRLMGTDEAQTVRDLKAHQAVLFPMVSEFGGRIIDTAGDGILAEFASAVNAVECALAIQNTMAERNAAVDQARRMQLRIGVNIGDVICDEARIYGDGINVAARLEGIAEPGGVCVSEDAWRQTRGKVDAQFTDIGEQNLKNIARPVRAYKVVLDGSSTETSGGPATIIEPRGSIDTSSATAFGDRIIAAISSGSRNLVVDLQHVVYISSAGFRALLVAHKRADEAKAKLVLCGISAEVRRLFELGRFLDLFTICATRDEAIAKAT